MFLCNTMCNAFAITNKLEKFKFKLEKNIGIQKHAGKVRKCIFSQFVTVLILSPIFRGIEKLLMTITSLVLSKNFLQFSLNTLFLSLLT